MDAFFKFLDDFFAAWMLLFLSLTWLLGFTFAKGFWSTLFCIIPFYAWYLDIEKLVQYYHWTH
jgi:hypothetical protein